MSLPDYILNDLSGREQNLFREICEYNLNNKFISKNTLINGDASKNKALKALIKKNLVFIDTKNDAICLTESGHKTASFEVLI